MSQATVIAEDLVVREPSTQAHLDRYRRALVASGDLDPDARIAERCRTIAGDGGASDGLGELGDDFFDESEPTASASQASTHDGEVAGRLAAVKVSVDGGGPAAALEAESGVDLNEGGPDLSSLFAEDFEPAVVKLLPASPEPEAAPAGGVPAGESMKMDLTSVFGDLEGTGVTGAPSRPAPAMDRPTMPAGIPPAPSLDEVFDQIRDEVVSDASVEEPGAQQYQLGLSYRQMGKLDEAIAALETAARSTRYRFNSAVMLGRLYFDKQEPARALDWLERAAEAPGPSDDDHHALLYHFGVTLERLGENARALGVFMELQSNAGEYRDVGERVGRLGRLKIGG